MGKEGGGKSEKADELPCFMACSASFARSACSSSFAFAFAAHSSLSHCFRPPFALGVCDGRQPKVDVEHLWAARTTSGLVSAIGMVSVLGAEEMA